MTKRKIITIDEDKCNGCGLCIPNCPEGAIQMIDGKARLLSDIFCDGLGACLGHCPEGAIEIIEREAEDYDERKAMENITKAGKNTIIAHLKHLQDHGETEYIKTALEVLEEKGIEIKEEEYSNKTGETKMHQGCPGSKVMDFSNDKNPQTSEQQTEKRPSELRQWPVQLHLVPPNAPYFKNKDVLLAADCVGFSLADFHKDFLKDKSLAIACPKLDSDQEIYIEKITDMIDNANINTLTVMTMEVPCCGGLLHIAKTAASNAKRKVPLKSIVVGIKGNILSEDWV